jgi:hypothetical protein
MDGSQHKQFLTPKIRVWKSQSPFFSNPTPLSQEEPVGVGEHETDYYQLLEDSEVRFNCTKQIAKYPIFLQSFGIPVIQMVQLASQKNTSYDT